MRIDRLPATRLLAWGLCIVLMAGCGRFADADRAAEPVRDGAPNPAPTDTQRPVDVVDPPRGTDPAPAQPEPHQTQGTDGTAASHRPVANAASAVTDGLEVEVVAEGGPDYASHPAFRIQVTLRNHSDRTRHYFLGQGNFAALVDDAGAVVWRSADCNPTLDTYEIYGGAAPLEPGEEVPVVVRYPAPESVTDPRCELPDGRYTLHGLFPVCPEEHVEETANPGTYACPEETVRQHASAGLPITFGGG